jgi:membrane-associated phospholipid phosphatase
MRRCNIKLRLSMSAMTLVVASVLPVCIQAQEIQNTECEDQTHQGCPNVVTRSFGAVKAYVTGPLHWTSTQWLAFGGAVAAIGLAHHWDADVRTHFTGNSAAAFEGSSTHSFQDALPAAALFVGTWGYAQLIDDSDGRRETGAMLEATVLGLATDYVLNYASGRKSPNQTTDPNKWFSGGSSFPSEHTTAAFAIGTVLAESGNGDYRWLRRVLGYGAAGFTGYERLRHNAHWLSDTIAGAALGATSARFAMGRQHTDTEPKSAVVALTPLPHGMMLRYERSVPW